MTDASRSQPNSEPRISPDSEIRPLLEVEVVALHDLADKGNLFCGCEGSPELCHCSTIMMLCDEWRAMRASVKPDDAQAAPFIGCSNSLCVYYAGRQSPTPPQGVAVTDLDADTIEECAKIAANLFGGKAHAYASENADLYRAQDEVCKLIAAKIRSLALSRPNAPQEVNETYRETARKIAAAREKRLAELVEENARLRSDAPNEVRKSALEEAASLMQRWSDEAAEFKDSERCVIQGNVCHSAAIAIRNLSKSDVLSRPQCATCGGRGEVGGFVNAESGHQTDPCPECQANGLCARHAYALSSQEQGK